MGYTKAAKVIQRRIEFLKIRLSTLHPSAKAKHWLREEMAALEFLLRNAITKSAGENQEAASPCRDSVEGSSAT